MSPLAEKVYKALAGRDWLPSKVVAELLDLSDDRLLRGRHSLVEKVNAELLREKAMAIVSRTGNPSGMKLTNNPAEFLAASAQVSAHARSEKAKADALRATAVALLRGQSDSQMNIFEGR